MFPSSSWTPPGTLTIDEENKDSMEYRLTLALLSTEGRYKSAQERAAAIIKKLLTPPKGDTK